MGRCEPGEVLVEEVVLALAVGVVEVAEGGVEQSSNGVGVVRCDATEKEHAEDRIDGALDAATRVEAECEFGGGLLFKLADGKKPVTASLDAAGVDGFLQVGAVEGAKVVTRRSAPATACTVVADAWAEAVRFAC